LIAAVREALSSEARVVTLVGPSGIGKSWIARQIDGVLCNLAQVSSEQELHRAIARAVGIRPRGDLARAVAKKLGERTLVLDDADTAVEAVASFVSALGSRVLVTAFEPLGIEGERVVPVAPLGLEEAIQLYEREAEGAAPREEIADLVTRLEGLPLAIVLAARRSSVVGPKELLERLDRGAILRSSRRDVPARQVTLEATFEWTLGLLSEDERNALIGISVFALPPTLEAYEAVVELAGDPIDALDGLMRRRVVTRNGSRLEVSRMLRRHLAPRVGESLRASHAAYVLRTAEALAASAYGPEAKATLAAMGALAAEALVADLGPRERARVLVALGDAIVLEDAIDLRSPLLDAAVAETTGDLHVRACVLRARVLLELGEAEAARAILADLPPSGAVDRSLGWALLGLGSPAEALPVLERALTAEREVRGQADALAASGLARCLIGEIEEGHARLARAHALHVGADDAIRRAKVEEMAHMVGLALGPAPTAEELEASARKHAASGRAWREALDLARVARPPARKTWTLTKDASRITTPDGETIDLERHGTLRRVLAALVTRQTPLSAMELAEAGWPGEKVLHDAAMLRVYTAVRRLRKLGLEGLLRTYEDGYALDPRVPLRIE
jgi:hypothetical protein